LVRRWGRPCVLDCDCSCSGRTPEIIKQSGNLSQLERDAESLVNSLGRAATRVLARR
jgi:hypothetical protein